MSIYVIGDLHLSFKNPKPMNIFGDNWNNHEEKIKQDWLSKVKEEDTVVLAGDFSWAMKIEDALEDFQYINELPGKKILLKGNHDYWWTTITSMRKFLLEHNLKRSLSIEDTVEDKKIIDREVGRLNLSINDAIKRFGDKKEIIAFLHYPPITQANILKNESSPFIDILRQNKIKKCYYGHLHGSSIKDAVNGNIGEIELKLISADGVDFKLQKIF